MKYRKEPLASWAITWIAAAWVYLWPFFELHGVVRFFVGIPWLTITVFITVAVIRRRTP